VLDHPERVPVQPRARIARGALRPSVEAQQADARLEVLRMDRQAFLEPPRGAGVERGTLPQELGDSSIRCGSSGAPSRAPTNADDTNQLAPISSSRAV